MVKRILAVGVISILSPVFCSEPFAGAPVDMKTSASRKASSVSQNPLLKLIKVELQRRSPTIHHVGIIDLKPFPEPDARKYAMIGWGMREDKTYSGDFSEELYGFFEVDSSLQKIVKVLKIVNTPRWGDYSFRLEVSVDTITVKGQGSTYGDQPRRFDFAWNPYK